MGYECKIIADSISEDDVRLTTFQVTFPRFVLPEFNTHRMLSKNGASLRAISSQRMIKYIREDPLYPKNYGEEKLGMSWEQLVEQTDNAYWLWSEAITNSLDVANKLTELKVHKSLVNRLVAPFAWQTMIVTATDWSNFFALRTHSDAQPELREIAIMMRDAYQSHSPRLLLEGQYHMPFTDQSEIAEHPSQDWKMISAARCARVSYLGHIRKSIDEDLNLAHRLMNDGHMSPFEHVARPFSAAESKAVDNIRKELGFFYCADCPRSFTDRLIRNIGYCGNLYKWWSIRADIPNEDDFSKVLKEKKKQYAIYNQG